MKNNSGLWNATFGEIGATLKVLQDQGLTLEDLALLRSNKDLAKKVAETIEAFKEAEKSLRKNSNIIRLVSGVKKLVLPESDGRAIIVEAKNVFDHLIAHISFEKKGLIKEGKNVPETEVEVYEMTRNAIFKEIFFSFSGQFDSLCLTQNQIIDFCVKHSEHLKNEGLATFFLTKKDFERPSTEDNLFVVSVHVYSFGLNVYVYSFDEKNIWIGSHRQRFVFPVLPKSS
ncbi:MAG TPA: hypothetical protein PK142_03305 [bacterium]|nr:hypothetical protein [bacterium]